jgi:hypothetical protein
MEVQLAHVQPDGEFSWLKELKKWIESLPVVEQ